MNPPHDENIIYNFHCYEPLIFTHQGAPWIPKMDFGFEDEWIFPVRDEILKLL